MKCLAVCCLILTCFGCATAPMTSFVNGPVSVNLGDVAHMCRLSGHDSPRGCVFRRPGDRFDVYCRDNSREELAECLAHEIRHIVEPEWRH